MTPLSSPTSDTLKRLLDAAHIELDGINHNPFSDKGFVRLIEKIDDYIVELVTEAVRVARRVESDTISPAYVEEASKHLVTGKVARWHRLIGAVGGSLFGMGLTTVYTMINSNQFSTKPVIVSVALIISGLIALTFHVLKD